ncbi:MAG TPA: glycolate oxidase subunit GlcE [Candidatus Omnitrophota bacterium]|nr:glycolate oxidase subunit GlcE [Candidatus Omnitrophota bacterium]
MLAKPANAEQLKDAIGAALADNRPLEVIGAGSKRGYGRPLQTAGTLDLSALSGIVSYEPEELVVSVRAGTLLAELKAALAERRQRLAFEPADWGVLLGSGANRATIGGIVAANVAGPRRVSQGAARDHVLGLKCVSGRGEDFVCGGRVVKNVTGFDLPKLLTGSLGTLAVIHEITLRVAPWPDAACTLALRDLDDSRAVAAMTKALSSPYEVSAAAHAGGTTALRLEGPLVSVAARAEALSHELTAFGPVARLDGEQSLRLWRGVRNVTAFATDDRIVWRLMVPPAASARVVAAIAASHQCEAIYDRGGALVWLALAGPDAAPDFVRGVVEGMAGHATLFRAPEAIRAKVPPFHPEPAALHQLSARLKAAFDPQRILNPGRMAADI